jgi:hypothetical protein
MRIRLRQRPNDANDPHPFEPLLAQGGRSRHRSRSNSYLGVHNGRTESLGPMPAPDPILTRVSHLAAPKTPWQTSVSRL